MKNRYLIYFIIAGLFLGCFFGAVVHQIANADSKNDLIDMQSHYKINYYCNGLSIFNVRNDITQTTNSIYKYKFTIINCDIGKYKVDIVFNPCKDLFLDSETNTFWFNYSDVKPYWVTYNFTDILGKFEYVYSLRNNVLTFTIFKNISIPIDSIVIDPYFGNTGVGALTLSLANIVVGNVYKFTDGNDSYSMNISAYILYKATVFPIRYKFMIYELISGNCWRLCAWTSQYTAVGGVNTYGWIKLNVLFGFICYQDYLFHFKNNTNYMLCAWSNAGGMKYSLATYPYYVNITSYFSANPPPYFLNFTYSSFRKLSIYGGYDIDRYNPISTINPIIPYINNTGIINLTAIADDNISYVKNVTLWYRYSVNNITWSTWMQNITDSIKSWNWSFTCPNGTGYYEFYSIAIDNASNIELAPINADAKCYYYVMIDTRDNIEKFLDEGILIIDNSQLFLFISLSLWLYFAYLYIEKRQTDIRVMLAFVQLLLVFPLNIFLIDMAFVYPFGFAMVFIIPILSFYLVADSYFIKNKNKR